MVEMRNDKNPCGILVGRSECKRLLGSSRIRQEDNNKMDLKEKGQRALTGLI
jgi:hypothetical protein